MIMTVEQLRRKIREALEVHMAPDQLDQLGPEEAYGLGYYAGRDAAEVTDDQADPFKRGLRELIHQEFNAIAEQGWRSGLALGVKGDNEDECADEFAVVDELVSGAPGSRHYSHPEHVKGYTTKRGKKVAPHSSTFTGLEKEYTPEWEQDESIDEKEYHASDGSVAALKDSGDSCKKAVKAGKFNWAGKGKWAACQSAHIATTGKPTVQKGAHFAGGKGPGGGGKGSHLVKPREGKKK